MMPCDTGNSGDSGRAMTPEHLTRQPFGRIFGAWYQESPYTQGGRRRKLEPLLANVVAPTLLSMRDV